MIELINPTTGQPATESDFDLVVYAYGKGPYLLKEKFKNSTKAKLSTILRDNNLDEILPEKEYKRFCADIGRKAYKIKYHISIDRTGEKIKYHIGEKLIGAKSTRDAIEIFESLMPWKWYAAMPLAILMINNSVFK